ncbi:MAG: ATP-binding cassette domain-containing protein [Candidatus Babeliales bacterium]
MSNFAINIKNLCKSYGNFKVLKDVNLQVKSGAIFALLGPNGAGKTTLLHIIATLLKPDSGIILIDDIDLIKFPNKVKQLIGIVGQYASIDCQLTGLENLKLIARLHHLSKQETNDVVRELLEKFKLTDVAHKFVSKYSGGMRRRLDLAASLVSKPRILFLDEPTTGLDPNSREMLWKIIHNLAENGTTIFLTTQYLEEADRLADKIAIINHGEIIACDTADYLKTQIGEEYFSIIVSDNKDIEAIKNSFSGMNITIDSKSRTINFSISNDLKGIYTLQIIINRLLENKISIQHYNVHRPTLDDVFMKLTDSETKEKKQ